MNFKRIVYNQLKAWLGKSTRKPLMLRGARQVGKTFLLKAFGAQEFDSFHYFNFEEKKQLAGLFQETLTADVLLNKLSLFQRRPIDSSRDLIIFDEIQTCPQAITSLKYFAENLEHGFIIAAGSLLGVELNPASYPVGKIQLLDMYPLTFGEFLAAVEDQKLAQFYESLTLESVIDEPFHEILWQRLLDYFAVGGLPEAIAAFLSQKTQLAAVHAAREVQKTLYRLYLSDVAKHSGKENAMHVERVFESIPAQLARSLDGGVTKYQFKGVIPGAGRYSRLSGPINWLEKAGLIIKSYIVDSVRVPLKALVTENRFKLYLFDIGIMGALAELPPEVILQQNYGSYKGYLAENFVAQEFTALGEDTLYSWEGRSSKIEFLSIYADTVVPIEVKSGRVVNSKSLKVFRDKYSPPFGVILSARNKPKHNRPKQLQIPLYLAGKLPRGFEAFGRRGSV